MARYTLYISPCPNDTFAFYALIHGLVETEGVEFELHFDDIERLNNRILNGKGGGIVKGSIAIKPLAESRGYTLLDSGAALGRGNGPIVVRGTNDSTGDRVVALPGEHTTATLLFNRYFRGYSPKYTIFNKVSDMVESGEATLGVLIHEGRFTYNERGLEFVGDLGQMWEQESSMPLPLGGIYMNSGLECAKVERAIRRSVEWAMTHPDQPIAYARSYASELSEEVLRHHIDFFVNEYTVTLGTLGREAIDSLVSV